MASGLKVKDINGEWVDYIPDKNRLLYQLKERKMNGEVLSITDLSAKDLLQLHSDEYCSFKDIADLFDMHPEQIRRIMQKQGFDDTMRKFERQAEAAAEAIQNSDIELNKKS